MSTQGVDAMFSKQNTHTGIAFQWTDWPLTGLGESIFSFGLSLFKDRWAPGNPSTGSGRTVFCSPFTLHLLAFSF